MKRTLALLLAVLVMATSTPVFAASILSVESEDGLVIEDDFWVYHRLPNGVVAGCWDFTLEFTQSPSGTWSIYRTVHTTVTNYNGYTVTFSNTSLKYNNNTGCLDWTATSTAKKNGVVVDVQTKSDSIYCGW